MLTALVFLMTSSISNITVVGSDLVLTEAAEDEGLPAYRIETPTATWFLEKSGAGLSSLIDKDGNDWLSFHPQPGTGSAGEYRGFPNAVHQQGGNFFHPRNKATEPSTTRVDYAGPDRVTISATSTNGLWGCRYDFFPTHCTLTMTRVPDRWDYWVLYEGAPGGVADEGDWWMTSAIRERQPLARKHEGDIPGPEWIAFGDKDLNRVLWLLNHQDDDSPDNYYLMNSEMTVFGFGRQRLRKFLHEPGAQFSIGLIEDVDHGDVRAVVESIPHAEAPTGLDTGPLFPPSGRFHLSTSLQMGLEHGTPRYREGDNWFRVNSPSVSLDAGIKDRYETRYNGLMMLRADTDITELAGAELALEVWGGHPGTHNKRFIVNGRSTYTLPEVGSADNHCTHSYPVIPLSLSDLVNGYNAFQFTCDKVSGWGHFIVHDAKLNLELPADHAALKEAGLANFQASVETSMGDDPDSIELSVKVPDEFDDRIARVDYQAFYFGYDENGNGQQRDWHGMTAHQVPVGIAGSSTETPFKVRWDTSLIPAQDDIAVRAIVSFQGDEQLTYTTVPTSGLTIPERPTSEVTLLSPDEIPIPFWSRADRLKTCEIHLPTDPENVERAMLHLVIWGDNPGTIEDYFQLNGHSISLTIPDSQGPIFFHQINVPPEWLRPGANRIELLSDTEHHGIEVLLPGPALMVRTRK